MRRVFWAVLGVDPPLFPGSLASILEATPAATPEHCSILLQDGTEASVVNSEEGRLEATEARDPSTVRPNGDERRSSPVTIRSTANQRHETLFRLHRVRSHPFNTGHEEFRLIRILDLSPGANDGMPARAS